MKCEFCRRDFPLPDLLPFRRAHGLPGGQTHQAICRKCKEDLNDAGKNTDGT